MKTLVLLSGGMDSVTALYHTAKSNEHQASLALSFDYGSKHNACEIPFAEEHCRVLGIPHRTVKLDVMEQWFQSDLLKSGGEIPEGHYEEASMKQTVVPFRNGIMLSIAAGMAESMDLEGIVIAAHAGDHAIYPDCRQPFMQAMGDAIREGTYLRLEILSPFLALTKTDILKAGLALGVDYAKTWSCYKGQSIQCGKCGTCVERREAFLLAGIPDPTDYESTPPIPEAPATISE